MVRPEVIRKRLSKVEESIGILANLAGHSFDEFYAKPELYGSTERFLHLVVEGLIDVGNHVVSDLNLGPVNYYSDIPNLLHANGRLNEGQKDLFLKMIGFRNALVHDYCDIDRRIVYDLVRNRLDDIRDLMSAFAVYL
jgi:uncharacterized protein YutE (UPF0331/DUF86 family)